MNDEELLRYSRQLLLPEIDIAGQQRLGEAKVLLVGLGGLGSPVAMYLAAAGVGRLVLCDDDVVELSNLQRQVAYVDTDIGKPKTDAMQARLRAMNSHVECEGLGRRIDEQELRARLADIDVVVDGSDNFATRQAVNRACLAARVPLVSGAVIRWEGQLSVFDFRDDDAACYACLYGTGEAGDGGCSENGVVAAMPGLVGSMQALEVIKLLTGAGEPLRNRLLLIDGKALSFRTLQLKRDPACPVCGAPVPGAS